MQSNQVLTKQPRPLSPDNPNPMPVHETTEKSGDPAPWSFETDPEKDLRDSLGSPEELQKHDPNKSELVLDIFTSIT